MTRTLLTIAIAVAVALPLTAVAQGEAAKMAAPTKDEIARVVSYYMEGKGSGPVLTEFKPCLEVDTKKGSATQWECVQPVAGAVKKNTPVHAWTSWLVPQGDKYDDIMVQFVHEGVVRATNDASVTAALRTRTYKTKTLNKTGKWEIKILRGSEELAAAVVNVEE